MGALSSTLFFDHNSKTAHPIFLNVFEICRVSAPLIIKARAILKIFHFPGENIFLKLQTWFSRKIQTESP